MPDFFNRVRSGFFCLTFLFFSWGMLLAQDTFIIPPFENTGKAPRLGDELSLGMAEVLGEVFRSKGTFQVPATPSLRYNVLANLPFDLTNGYGLRLGEKDLEARSRSSFPGCYFLGGSYRVEHGRVFLKAWFVNAKDPKAGGKFEKDAAYPGEVFSLLKQLANWVEAGNRNAEAFHDGLLAEPRDYKVFESYVEGIRHTWRLLPDYQEPALLHFLPFAPLPTNAGHQFKTAPSKTKAKKNTTLVTNLPPEAPFFFSVAKAALIRSRLAKNREAYGFEVAPSNVDAFWAGTLAALKLAPRHPPLNQAAAYGAIRLRLGETAWGFLQAADPWRTEDGRNADPEVDRLYSMYYEKCPERSGGAENGNKLAFETLRKVSRLYPNDVRTLVDLARINREEGVRAAQAGSEKKASINFRATKNFLDRAILLDRENPWVYDGFALFYLQKENRAFYNKEVAIGSALTAVEKSGGRIPLILFTLAQVLLANNERSRAYFTMDRIMALTKRPDYVQYYEEMKAGKR